MDTREGIVIGTVNRLQLNKWASKGVVGKWLWQLIAIFDKVKWFRDQGLWFSAQVFPLAGPEQQIFKLQTINVYYWNNWHH
jgi:hypothetical protein